MIVLPAIDLRGGHVVRLVRGRPEAETRYGDDPAGTAAALAAEGATWLHVVDLDAALGSGDNRAALRRILAAVDVRVQTGGGLRTHEAIDAAIREGAARAVVGTEAVRDPAFLRAAVERHGEAIAVAVDVDGDEVRVRGWTEGAGHVDEVLEDLLDAGARRLVVTQVARDGTLEGPDLALYRRLVERTRRPVVASGGVRTTDDVRALAEAGVEGVIVGTALYEGTLTLAEALEAAA